MYKINLSDAIRGDIIRIFMDDKLCMNQKREIEVCEKGFLVTKYPRYDEPLTFHDCVAIARENGFTEGIFYIMADNPREGKIYQYANCYDTEPFVSEYGTTMGYA